MLFSRSVPLGLVFAAVANAQNTQLPSVSDSRTTISGTGGITEGTLPTGDYLSYTSTSTREISSPISTLYATSTISSRSTTRTTSIATATLLGIGTPLIGGNDTATSTNSSSTTNSQTLLLGSVRATTSLNGTSNSTASSTSSLPQATNTTPCNNYAEFCSRKYSNITEVAAHNSPFVLKSNAAANQALGVTSQLNDGIRLLQGQMHFVGDIPHFCHSSCDILDAGPITDYLTEVNTWVESHPYDIVTILLGNGNYSLVNKYIPFIEESGLVNHAYIPPKVPMAKDDWPTLASMILSGQRVVFFLDYDTNQTSFPWLLDEFSQAWETPFDPTNRSFPCSVQRPPGLSVADAQNRIYLMNHNLNYDINLLGNSLLVPNIPLLNITNNVTGDGSLGVSTQECTEQWGAPPKFLNVDYYNVGKGSVFEVAAKYNNVTYNRKCCGLPASAGVRIGGSSLPFVAALVVGLLVML
ncbi:PLC-like phosphodiesterase [Amylocarpus encephaloides]|uniref:PLC-like phosphodiesterase n=1 Tax=Amylocarpus encephaloides TaxID=45428 RepID=A0A9P8CAJ4_9HELO|nr:PLC-like phosphodiesterase [Amylocarpus encephaloides]